MSKHLSDSEIHFQPKPIDQRFIDLEGREFGRLKVIGYAGRIHKFRIRYWFCECRCGNKCAVCTGNLKRGIAKSCGCLHKEMMRRKMFKHGCSINGNKSKRETAEYRAWQCIINRCCNPNGQDFALYGGRGIIICDRWRHDFKAFLADVGKRPSPKHSIDRFPNQDGNYEPGNVRWASQKEQCRNKRNNRLIEYDGKTMCLAAWAELLGVHESRIRGRLNAGYSVKDALTAPPRPGSKPCAAS